MPSTTPNHDIRYPEVGDNLTPLAPWFAGLAQDTDAALTAGLAGAPLIAYSDAERNALVPTPVQGNLVTRPDKGHIEQYYAVYNASTNPGGAPTAGWYPTGQRKILAPAPTAGTNMTLSNNNLYFRDGWLLGSIDWTKSGTALAHADIICTLPVGWRPEHEYVLNSVAGPAPSLAGAFIVFRADGVVSTIQPPATRTTGSVKFAVPLPV